MVNVREWCFHKAKLALKFFVCSDFFLCLMSSCLKHRNYVPYSTALVFEIIGACFLQSEKCTCNS